MGDPGNVVRSTKQSNAVILVAELRAWASRCEQENMLYSYERLTKAADEIERLRELARGVIESLRCEHVHHARPDWHEFTAPCPVLARLRAAIETSGEQK